MKTAVEVRRWFRDRLAGQAFVSRTSTIYGDDRPTPVLERTCDGLLHHIVLASASSAGASDFMMVGVYVHWPDLGAWRRDRSPMVAQMAELVAGGGFGSVFPQRELGVDLSELGWGRPRTPWSTDVLVEEHADQERQRTLDEEVVRLRRVGDGDGGGGLGPGGHGDRLGQQPGHLGSAESSSSRMRHVEHHVMRCDAAWLVRSPCGSTKRQRTMSDLPSVQAVRCRPTSSIERSSTASLT